MDLRPLSLEPEGQPMTATRRVKKRTCPEIFQASVADLLRIGYHRRINLLRSRCLAPPQKGTSGDCVWTDEDIERARNALAASRQGGNCPLTPQVAPSPFKEGSRL